MELTLMELTGDGTIDLGENTLTVGGLFLTYYKNAHLVQEGDKVVLKAEEQTDNVYAGERTRPIPWRAPICFGMLPGMVP